MSDEPKPKPGPLVPTVRETLATAQLVKDVIDVVPLNAGGTLNFTRTEAILSINTHQSISPELMTLGVKEAEARAAAAEAQYAVPARERTNRTKERTRQVMVVCVGTLLVVSVGLIASVTEPKIAPWAMGMVTILAVAIGAVYGLNLWANRPNSNELNPNESE